MAHLLLEHLDIAYKKEGSQWVIDCPQCGKLMHCHVAPDTGLWHCKVCGGKGNPYQLAEKLTSLDSKGIMELLSKHGLADGDQQQEAAKKPQKLNLRPDEIMPLEGDELQAFCDVKGVSVQAYLTMFSKAWRYTTKPWALLMATSPEKPDTACGVLRCQLDGGLIKLGDGKEVKYPIVAGSRHGLFGVRRILDDDPDTILFTEGWRDALAAVEALEGEDIGVTASSGGASTWYDEWLPLFEESRVYILMDADKPGQRAAQRAAEAIYPVAKEVRIIQLPYEIQKDNGKDLYDYLHSM